MSYFAQGHALVIGIGDYTGSGLKNLPAARNDAAEIAAILVDRNQCAYPPAQIRTLIDHQATARNIRAELQRIAQEISPESTVLIYFSGHGAQIAEGNNRFRTYLCPRDANLRNLENTAISRDEFSSLLANIKTQKMVVLLDCCHAAGTVDLKSPDQGDQRWMPGLSAEDIRLLAEGAGRVVLASSESDQPSVAYRNISLFTEELIRGLQGGVDPRQDGAIGVLDLFDYVARRVASHAEQRPIMHAKNVSENFPIALYCGGTLKSAGAAAGPQAEQVNAPAASHNNINFNAPATIDKINQGPSADEVIKLIQAIHSLPKS